eukprot:TRINITY_DN4392_c0_g2_i1.p1 TRINITY_DN4392_c0_g2~~TRINITY_DN4392_c0_g2_i1.p1  ORF type:complete len:319 (-),score=52.37 TRINITY_DN4392_c0_g2_i1:115-1071(-)
MGKTQVLTPSLVGVTPAFTASTFSNYLTIDKEDTTTGLSLTEQLYRPSGSQSAIISTSWANKLSINLEANSSFLVMVYNGSYSSQFEIRAQAILKLSPAMTMSALPSSSKQSVMVSIPTYAQFCGGLRLQDVPYEILLVQFKSYSDAAAERVYDTLNSATQESPVVYSIWDYRDVARGIEKNSAIVSATFVSVTIIAMFLCFFSLASSMSANILDQTKEIAIMRALGLTKRRMIILYVYEAFVLVFSSSLSGVVIGACVGWTLTAQQILFTQLPIPFGFPWTNLLVIFLVSVACAIASATIPAYSMMKRQISTIARLN